MLQALMLQTSIGNVEYFNEVQWDVYQLALKSCEWSSYFPTGIANSLEILINYS